MVKGHDKRKLLGKQTNNKKTEQFKWLSLC